MKNVLLLLSQSRKAIVALTSILGAVVVSTVGVMSKMPVEAVLGLVGAITGLSWKLMETIALEDNAKRTLGGFYDVHEEGRSPLGEVSGGEEHTSQ